MRTAIFVYQTTPIHILTCEGSLELCSMHADALPLSEGQNDRTIAPGIYKIVSSHEVHVTGDTGDTPTFDVLVTPENKTNYPTPPPSATETFAGLDVVALQTFFAVPDASELANP